MRLLRGIVLFVVVYAVTGCDGSRPGTPSAPSVPSTPVAPTPPATIVLRVFTDPVSGFSTSDVRDAQDQIVQFNSAGELIWTATGSHFSGYPHDGYDMNVINAEQLCHCWLEIRFGIRNGERGAYLTADYGHSNPGTVVHLEVVNGAVVMSQSTVVPPGSRTMSGRATEATPAGDVPVEGVDVWRSYGSGWQVGKTDANGYYEIRGLYDGRNDVEALKDGYQPVKEIVAVDGDTRFDVHMVRR